MATSELREVAAQPDLADQLEGALLAMEQTLAVMEELKRDINGFRNSGSCSDRAALEAVLRFGREGVSVRNQVASVERLVPAVEGLVTDQVGFAAFKAWRHGEFDELRELLAARDALAERRGAKHG